MTLETASIHVAIIGSGMAGAACAAGLRSADVRVTLFEKSRNVGGRMATRRAGWVDGDGAEQSTTFDHGAQWFTPAKPRFKAVMARAIAAGSASRWQPRLHAARPVAAGPCFVATPTTPALCSHLLTGATVHLHRDVRRLQRGADGAWYVAAEGVPLAGPFQHVVLAMPPAQAAVLLAGHKDDWADALIAQPMAPCWTLMVASDDVDWPWDAAEPVRGPLASVLRNDRLPGRSAPGGVAVWTAHASAAWSTAHLEDDAQAVSAELQSALRAQLPRTRGDGQPIRFHHVNVHRWRYARPAVDGHGSFGGRECLWDETLGLGVCGDFLAGGGVEAAWHSGDELADCMAVSFEQMEAEPVVPTSTATGTATATVL